MRLHIIVAAVALAIVYPAAAQETYVIDGVHSRPSFEVRHLGMTYQWGIFDKISGKATLNRAAKSGSVEVTIDPASVKTFDSRLDGHLKGEKWFNVEKHPTITFKSSHLAFDGDRVVGIDGDLTLLGVTKPVNLKVVNFTCGENPANKRAMCGVDATATIKRSEFGMTNGIPGSVADEVKLNIPVEAYKE